MSSGYAMFDTKLGRCGLAWTDAGVIAMRLPDATAAETERGLIEQAKARHPGFAADRAPPPPFAAEAIALVTAHLAGENQDLSKIPVDLGAMPPFRRSVLLALRKVDPGTTVTYGALAERVGSPGAARAVGGAMASNPIPVIIPCHRVTAGGSKLGGFSAFGGLGTKRRLLAMEAAGLPALRRSNG